MDMLKQGLVNLNKLFVCALLLSCIAGCAASVGSNVVRTDDGEVMTVDEMWETMRK